MVKIGLLSDTHGYIDKRILEILNDCDEIWHAGDIGSLEVIEILEKAKPTRAVYGNIDGQNIRQICPNQLRFTIEGLDVFITHIGGYPGKYENEIKPILRNNPPKLFICGHSHILRVMNDPALNMLYMNPGAAGKYGFHQKRTMLLFDIEDAICKNLRVIEWEK
jgi:uncharacterized protein